MNGSPFRRVLRFGRARAACWLLYISSIIAAVLLPVLVLILGLLVQLQIPERPVSDWALGPLTRAGWPWFGDKYQCLLVLIGVGLVIGVLQIFASMLAARQVLKVALATAAELKSRVHSHAFQLGASDLLGGRRLRTEELFTDRIETVRQGVVAWYQAMPKAVVSLLLLLLVALAANPLLTVFSALLSACLWLVYRSLREQSRRAAREADDQTRQVHETLLDDLRLSPLSAGYALDRAQNEPFEDGLRQYQRSALRSRTAQTYVAQVMLFAGLIAAALVAFVIGFSDVEFSSVMLIAAALACAVLPAARLYRLRKELPAANAAAAEILTYLERRPAVAEQSRAQPLDRVVKQVELERVTLADREGRRLLDEVSLKIDAGRRIGVVASDSRTPLALAGLFVRLYDPAAGRVLFDERDIRQATLDTLRTNAAMVAPAGMLFTGAVAENITCGDARFDASLVQEAAKKARAYDFIQRLPDGFSSVIGEHGLRLDSSQAFRVALARALVRNPSLLVIEEPDGMLDEAAATEIQAAIQESADGRTLIFLPARLDTLRALDHIFLFHDGKVFAEGSHTDLIRTCELYRHLHYVRFNAFRNTVKAT
jgi:ABC-type multidrug transport system fused ATPase/permease subunit